MSVKDKDIQKMQSEHELELKSLKNRSESSLESVRNDHRIAEAKVVISAREWSGCCLLCFEFHVDGFNALVSNLSFSMQELQVIKIFVFCKSCYFQPTQIHYFFLTYCSS